MKSLKIILGIIGLLIGLSSLLWATTQIDIGTDYPLTTWVIGFLGTALFLGSILCLIMFLTEDKL